MSADNSGGTPSNIHQAAALGFGSTTSTAAYEAGRPSYSPQVIDALIVRALSRSCPLSRPHSTSYSAERPQLLRVLDVGAGTGIFTRILLQRLLQYERNVDPSVCFQLTAVEPVEGMRRKFREVTDASIPVLCGSGQDLSAVASSSVSVIFCAQSFHWMATAGTMAEFNRVLVPQGALVLIWNTRDRRLQRIDELELIIDSYYTPDVPRQQTGQFKLVFEEECARRQWSKLESETVEGLAQSGDLQLIVDRVLSISVIASLPEAERDAVAERVRHVVAAHPDNAGQSTFTLPYLTESYWTFKLN